VVLAAQLLPILLQKGSPLDAAAGAFFKDSRRNVAATKAARLGVSRARISDFGSIFGYIYGG
jgi:hypothetical protein